MNQLDKYSKSRIVRRCAQLGIPYKMVINSLYFSDYVLQSKSKDPFRLQYEESVKGTIGWGKGKRKLEEKNVIPLSKDVLLYLLNISDQPIKYTEGSPFLVELTRFERNIDARKKCIDYYGLSCMVCEFNFEQKYGVAAKDFIHVHHLKKISSIKKEYIVDPIKDLLPVCPNCHSIIHKKKIPYTIKEMKEIIYSARKNKPREL
jgi:hypothetical protein